MLKFCGLVFLIFVLPTLLAAPGDKGVCSGKCENAGASCVIDMERKSASCGKCDQGVTIFQSCYQPNGKCNDLCERKGSSCEVGRDPRVAECGKCKLPDGSDVPVDDQCYLVPNGRCDTKCGNPMASCTPSLTVVPSECGGCPKTMTPAIACREDYGRCSSKCGNSNRNCKPDVRQVPRECGTCKEEVTPAESCRTPPDGVCNDKCSRPRSQCTQAQPGTTIMPAACGSCFVNATQACLPIQQKCRISMSDSSGGEIVPVRVDSPNNAVYETQGRAGSTLRFNVIVVASDKTCGPDKGSQVPKVSIAEPKGVNAPVNVQPTKTGATDGYAYTIAVQLPGTNGGRYKVVVDTCCGNMTVMVLTPGGSSCIAWGDPHIITFDKMHYSYQGIGDYDMVTTAPGVNIDSDLKIQIRYCQMYNLVFDRNSQTAVEKATTMNMGFADENGQISTVKAIAAKEGDLHVAAYIYHFATSGRAQSSLFVVVKKPSDNTVRTIDLRTMTGTVASLIDGQPEYGTLKKSRGDCQIDFAKTGTQIQFNSFGSTTSMNANVAVRAGSAYYSSPKSVRGLCGDLDGDDKDDLHSKFDDSNTASEVSNGGGWSASVVNDKCKTCTSLADTWRVTSAVDSLFDYDNSIAGVSSSDLPVDDRMLPSLLDLQAQHKSLLQRLAEKSAKSVKVQADQADPFADLDPKIVEEAKGACKLLSPPFASEADKNNCINDFLIMSKLSGNTDAAQASVASIMNVQAKACEAAAGKDSKDCQAAGAGCEDYNGCNNMGKCVGGRCECVVGRVGDDCSIPAACDTETSCGKHGKCVTSDSGSRTYDCACNPGFGGEVCEYVITSDGKVLKLAGGTDTNGGGSETDTQGGFTPNKTEGVPTTVLVAIVVVFLLVAGGVMGGVIYYRKKQPQQVTKASTPSSVASMNSKKNLNTVPFRSSESNVEMFGGTPGGLRPPNQFARQVQRGSSSQAQRGSGSQYQGQRGSGSQGHRGSYNNQL